MSTTVTNGTSGDDELYASEGNKFIGHLGEDTLVFDGTHWSYDLVLQNLANLKASVTDSETNKTWDIRQVEWLQFSDGKMDVATGQFYFAELPKVALSFGTNPVATEGAGPMVFTINLSGPAPDDIVIAVRTRSPDATYATPGADYGRIGVSGDPALEYVTYTIPKGAQSFNIPVSIIDDGLIEQPESIGLAIKIVSGPGEYAAGIPVSLNGEIRATGTILDNDVAPPPPPPPAPDIVGVLVSTVTYPTPDSADPNTTPLTGIVTEGNEFTITFTRTDGDTLEWATDGTLTAGFQLQGGVGAPVPGVDFEIISAEGGSYTLGSDIFPDDALLDWYQGTVTFADGSHSVTLTVRAINDFAPEVGNWPGNAEVLTLAVMPAGVVPGTEANYVRSGEFTTDPTFNTVNLGIVDPTVVSLDETISQGGGNADVAVEGQSLDIWFERVDSDGNGFNPAPLEVEFLLNDELKTVTFAEGEATARFVYQVPDDGDPNTTIAPLVINLQHHSDPNATYYEVDGEPATDFFLVIPTRDASWEFLG